MAWFDPVEADLHREDASAVHDHDQCLHRVRTRHCRAQGRCDAIGQYVIDVLIEVQHADHVEFEWDERKNRENQLKHGLSFEDAVHVFDSDNEVLELFDEQHSDFAERFISIGPIHVGLVLVVWTERDEGVVRLISARVATPAEQRLHYRHLEPI